MNPSQSSFSPALLANVLTFYGDGLEFVEPGSGVIHFCIVYLFLFLFNS